MMNVDYKGIEIGELTANTDATFVPGRPVKIASSQVYAATVHADVLGLVNEWQYSGIEDEVSGNYGIYGSGRVSVVCKGIVTVEQSVINGVSYSVYNEAPTTAYASGQRLYVDSNGLITNATGATYTGITVGYIGMLLVPPTNAADGDPMQLLVE